MSITRLTRREIIRNLSLGIGGFFSVGNGFFFAKEQTQKTTIHNNTKIPVSKGNIRHSVCRWCYQNIPLLEFAQEVKKIGITAIDLLPPSSWNIIKKAGLSCSLATDDFASITDGFNDPKNHQALQQKYTKLISQAAEADIRQVIVFSGNRNGLSDEQGIENCVIGLTPLVKHAEKQGVVLVMELLNSKVDHLDYQCDHTEWGAALADKINSDHFKLLYDIYHMQIMEGDVIATIRKYKDYIAHYHTGGVPGRHEINHTQELQYATIMKEILKTGYKGYVAQEFIPTYDNKLASLKEGIEICDV